MLVLDIRLHIFVHEINFKINNHIKISANVSSLITCLVKINLGNFLLCCFISIRDSRRIERIDRCGASTWSLCFARCGTFTCFQKHIGWAKHV